MAIRRIVMLALTTALVVAGTVVSTALPSLADSGDGTSCVKGRWPADVQGLPRNLHAHGDTGLYIWHDSSGWHLRVTHPGSSHARFTGRVTTDGTLYGTARRTERNDHVVFSESAHGVAFRFENYGGIDGIDFKTKCANRITVNAQLNGNTLKPSQVFIGANAQHPGGVPFAIKRTA